MKAKRGSAEEFLRKCGWATARKATKAADPTRRRTPASADMPLEELVRHEDQFAAKLRSLAAGLSSTKIEIGEMIAAYEREHRHRYGDGLMRHLAEMAGLSVAAVYNYRSAWRLLERFREIPDLENLTHSHHVELGRLVDLPDAERLVGEVVAKVKEGHMTVQETAGLVGEVIRDQRRRPVPKKKEDAPKSTPPRLVDPLTPQEEQVLENAIAVLQQASSVESRPGKILHMAEHRMRIVRLGTGLIDHVSALVDAEPSDAENCGVMIEQIRDRCDVLLARLNRGRAA